MPQIRVVNVSKRYGSLTVLEHVSLNVEDGEYVSIIGPSGCGKTTLLRCVAGIIDPTEGEIYVDDKSLVGVPPEKRNIGYMFQEIALFPHMNARENAGYGPRVRGLSRRRVRTMADEALEMVKMSERSEDYPNELSGGARQKVALARAVGSAPSVLLLDEPLGSLDASVRLSLRMELRRLAKELGLTAIHVTHDQEEAMSISDRIVIMRAGRVVEVGKPQNLYLDPRQIFTANFLGEANFMRARLMATGENGAILDVGGEELNIESRTVPRDSVVAIRPQFIRITKRQVEGSGWRGKIAEKTFLGDVVRFQVNLENGFKITAQMPPTAQDVDADVGDEVSANFQRDKLLTFPCPTEGLEKELSAW